MKSLVFVVIAVAIQVAPSSAAEKCWNKIDIGIIVNMKKCLGREIDGSIVKPLLKNYIEELKAKLGDNKNVRVGVVSYGETVQIRYNFTDDQDRAALLEAVNKYKFEPGNMPLHEALDECINEESCFPSHDDNSVKKVLIVLTDARGEDSKALSKQVDEFKKRGYSFYAHNIDDLSEFASLKKTLSVVGDEQCPNVTRIIGELVAKIEKEKCDDEQPNVKPTEPPTPPKVIVNGDIVFVVDSSFSLTRTQWEQEVNFTKDVASQLVIDGTAGARFAAITFDNKIMPGFNWTDDALKTLIGLDGLKFGEGYATFTGAAMFEAINVHFGTQYVPRSGKTVKIIVVITDGSPSIPSDVTAASKAAQSKDIDVLAVGVGPNMSIDGKPSTSMLDIVGGDASRLFLVDDHSQLSDKILDLIRAMEKLPNAE